MLGLQTQTTTSTTNTPPHPSTHPTTATATANNNDSNNNNNHRSHQQKPQPRPDEHTSTPVRYTYPRKIDEEILPAGKGAVVFFHLTSALSTPIPNATLPVMTSTSPDMNFDFERREVKTSRGWAGGERAWGDFRQYHQAPLALDRTRRNGMGLIVIRSIDESSCRHKPMTEERETMEARM